MLRKIDTPSYEAFLVRFRPAPVRFDPDRRMDPAMVSVWTALTAEAWAAARRLASEALAEPRMLRSDVRAGLLAGLAASELGAGRTEEARVAAGRSLAVYPRQWIARRLLVEVSCLRRDYAACYRQLSGTERIRPPVRWDEAMTELEVEIALASFSWRLGEWEKVAHHLRSAFPDGLGGMPEAIREDWFRLSLYRGLPDEAAAAASTLVDGRPVEEMDDLLQTIVQSGWTAHALPLYRNMHRTVPRNELIRRRLVALCIKEGELDEARRIVAGSALRPAA